MVPLGDFWEAVSLIRRAVYYRDEGVYRYIIENVSLTMVPLGVEGVKGSAASTEAADQNAFKEESKNPHGKDRMVKNLMNKASQNLCNGTQTCEAA